MTSLAPIAATYLLCLQAAALPAILSLSVQILALRILSRNISNSNPAQPAQIFAKRALAIQLVTAATTLAVGALSGALPLAVVAATISFVFARAFSSQQQEVLNARAETKATRNDLNIRLAKQCLTLTGQIEQLRKTVKDLKAKNKTTRKSLDQALEDSAKNREERANVQAQLEETKSTLRETQQKLARLERDRPPSTRTQKHPLYTSKGNRFGSLPLDVSA